MVTVACVLRSGGDYTPEYVSRLRDGVKENTTIDYRFVCFTDIPDQVSADSVIEIENDWPGWWAKINLFQITDSKVIYFDLDTVINGCIDDLLSYDHRFSMLEDFYHKGVPASGVMAWNGDYRDIMTGFDVSTITKYRTSRCFGDQGYIASIVDRVDFIQDIMPSGMIVSKKANNLKERESASVVCYHGSPRPHQVGWSV